MKKLLAIGLTSLAGFGFYGCGDWAYDWYGGYWSPGYYYEEVIYEEVWYDDWYWWP